MTDPQIRVEGLDQLVRTMKRAGLELEDLKDANRRVGDLVARAASSRAPRVSGALAGSIRPARQARRARVMVGGKRVPYAPVIHWGWPAHNITANPFLIEAGKATESEWVAMYTRDVQLALDKVRGV